MAIAKTPRKKPVKADVAEEKPAPKAKAAAVKKTAPKKSVAAEPKAKPASKASAKTPAKGKILQEMEAAPAPVSVPAPAPSAAKLAPKPIPKKSEAALTSLVETLSSAIREGRAVEFLFEDADANAPRTFEPRQLTFDALSQAWYVWGWDRRYNAERHHRLDLLAEVNAVEGVGRGAQGPYAEGTPGNQIGGWLGGEPIHVKATLLKQWVFAVKQAPPAFPQFKLEEQGEGQALVSFTATDLRAIARWAMQFGDGIQVQEPARLVDRIKQVGAVWAGRDRLPAQAPALKSSPRPEPAPEHRRQEARPHREARHDREPRPDRETRPDREARPDRDREREEISKAKPGKVEVIRFDRL